MLETVKGKWNFTIVENPQQVDKQKQMKVNQILICIMLLVPLID